MRVRVPLLVGLLLFGASVAHGVSQPYPNSPVITGVTWAPKSEIVRMGTDSDNWPVTWADDDKLYTAGGDGVAFGGTRKSLWVASISGNPPALTGQNIKALEPNLGGSSGKKGSGMLMVGGVLYLWVRNADNNGKTSQLAWSSDYGQNWTWSTWTFAEFGYPTFLNYGKNYAGARDTYVYSVSHDDTSAYSAVDRFILMRVPKSQITDKSKYEFFVQLDAGGNPVWSADVTQRGAVFSHTGNCSRSGISYNAALGRYLWWQKLGSGDTRFSGGFGIYDAPEPWGPWTTVYFTSSWDTGPGDQGMFPTKYMSADGKTCWLVFSGNDDFSVRKATFTVAAPSDTTPPSAPGNLQGTAPSNSQVDLTWTAATDPESGVSSYNVYRDGAKVGTSTTTSFSDTGLAEGTSYTYEVSAVNGAGLEGPKTAPLGVATLADATPPSIASVSATSSASVQVVFSEPVAQASAETMSNYAIDNGVTVSAAVLGADTKTVTLTVSTLSEGVLYTLTVNNVTDRATTPNAIAANSTATFTYVAQLFITNTNPATYTWATLSVGTLVYVDRTFTYTTVPAGYDGLDVLQTANADKGSTGASFITFDVNQDVTVYVAYDDRNASQPAWMSGFTDTGDNLVTSDTTLSLFAKDFVAGTVSLGGNETGTNSMYTVVVEPLGSGPPPPSDTTPPAVAFTSLRIDGQVSDPAVTAVQTGTGSVPVIAGMFSVAVNLSGTAVTVTLTAADAAGNSSTRSITVTGL